MHSTADETRLAPATVDQLLLAGLREHGGEISEGDLTDRLQIRYHTSPAERRDSLSRLVERGLVSRRTAARLNREHPLFDPIELELFQAIGGEA